jgi:hypothetical protein
VDRGTAALRTVALAAGFVVGAIGELMLFSS